MSSGPPPHIRASPSFSDMLAAALDGVQTAHLHIHVWVEWGDEPLELPFVLSVSSLGSVLASATSPSSHAVLECSIECGTLEPGETIVASLRWEAGSRHLHVPCLSTSLNFSGLVAPPAPTAADLASASPLLSAAQASFALEAPPVVWWRRSSAELSLAELCAPRSFHGLHLSAVERGFGVELELITSSGPGRRL